MIHQIIIKISWHISFLLSPSQGHGRGCWCLSQLHMGAARVHPWTSHQLIPEPHLSIWGMVPCPRVTSAVLWRCTGTSYNHTFHLLSAICVIWGLNPLLPSPAPLADWATAATMTRSFVGSIDSFLIFCHNIHFLDFNYSHDNYIL